MKSVVRLIAGVLIFSCLATFGIWRYDAIPDLSFLTDLVEKAAAEVEGAIDKITHLLPTDQNGEYPTYTLEEPPSPELEQKICDAFDAHEASINVSGDDLTPESAEAVITWVRFTHPEYFYVNGSFSYYTGLNGTVTAILPDYLYDEATTAAMMLEYDAVLDGIEAGAPVGSDFDRLLYLHDYFVREYSYDDTLTIRDAHTFFTQKTGVCQAYMLALIAAAERLGIESLPVTSDAMKHAWNLVCLDGEWYHVDLTWDDSVSLPTQTSYLYFLQSAQGLVNTDVAQGGDLDKDVTSVHNSWAAAETADSTKYDGAVWRGALSPMVKEGGTYYCVVSEPDNADKNVRGGIWGGSDPAALARLSDIQAVWRPSSLQYYTNCYACLAVYGGKLIYNTSSTLRCFDPATGTDILVAWPQWDTPIYGISPVSATGTVTCLLASSPHATTYTERTYQLS